MPQTPPKEAPEQATGNPSLRAICEALGVSYLDLARATKQPANTVRGRYYEGRMPSKPGEAEDIKAFLLLVNRKAKAVPPAVIRALWRAA